jgi:hypothetical protein
MRAHNLGTSSTFTAETRSEAGQDPPKTGVRGQYIGCQTRHLILRPKPSTGSFAA